MKLSGKQFAALSQARLDVFDRGSLTRMVRIELNEDLGQIASPGSLTQVVDDLVRWRERTNKVRELINGTWAQNPGKRMLQDFKQQAGREVWFDAA